MHEGVIQPHTTAFQDSSMAIGVRLTDSGMSEILTDAAGMLRLYLIQTVMRIAPAIIVRVERDKKSKICIIMDIG